MNAQSHCALIGQAFSAREEYCISLELFLDVNSLTASLSGSHRPFWILPTSHVNEFIRREFNRWISAIEFVWLGTQRDSTWKITMFILLNDSILSYVLGALSYSSSLTGAVDQSSIINNLELCGNGARLIRLEMRRLLPSLSTHSKSSSRNAVSIVTPLKCVNEIQRVQLRPSYICRACTLHQIIGYNRLFPALAVHAKQSTSCQGECIINI